MEILVDTRREKDFIPFLKREFPGITFTPCALNVGDYESAHVLVERKTIGDLYQSVLGSGTHPGRLPIQIGKMALSEKVTLFLITGGVADWVTKMSKELNIKVNPDIVYGTIASISCRERIHVIWVHDHSNALITMMKFILKVEEGKYMVPSKREPDQLSAKLLGVNIVQWKDLKRKFGSLSGVALAKEEDLQQVYGIGKVKAHKIKEILTKGI